jgi:hypothetical protein
MRRNELYRVELEKERVLWGNCEEMILIGTFRCRWENNIKMDVKEVGWVHGLD